MINIKLVMAQQFWWTQIWLGKFEVANFIWPYISIMQFDVFLIQNECILYRGVNWETFWSVKVLPEVIWFNHPPCSSLPFLRCRPSDFWLLSSALALCLQLHQLLLSQSRKLRMQEERGAPSLWIFFKFESVANVGISCEIWDLGTAVSTMLSCQSTTFPYPLVKIRKMHEEV